MFHNIKYNSDWIKMVELKDAIFNEYNSIRGIKHWLGKEEGHDGPYCNRTHINAFFHCLINGSVVIIVYIIYGNIS